MSIYIYRVVSKPAEKKQESRERTMGTCLKSPYPNAAIDLINKTGRAWKLLAASHSAVVTENSAGTPFCIERDLGKASVNCFINLN